MFYVLTKDECPWCDSVKELLTKRGSPFETFDYKSHKLIPMLMVRAGINTVPQVWVEKPKGKTYIGGFENLEQYLEYADTGNEND